MFAAQAFDYMFPLGDPPNYEPAQSDSISSRAHARGVNPAEEAYDRLLDEDGHAMLLVTLVLMVNSGAQTLKRWMERRHG